MPRKTDGTKIDEMQTVLATFGERLDNVRNELKESGANLADVVKILGEMKTDVALLRKDCEGLQKWKDDLKKEKDEGARRRWAFGPNVVGAIVNVLLGAAVSGIVTYFAMRHSP
jgi:hypothetical protein